MKKIWKKLKSFFSFSSKATNKELKKKKLRNEAMSSSVKVAMFLVGLFAEIVIIYYVALLYGIVEEAPIDGDKIAVIDFNQEVTQEYVNKVIEGLENAKDNNDYLEVLFIMNSPGGSPTASEELSEYLRDYNKTITMYVQGIAASGGYYIASAIKPLISNKNAMVGSIGVIMPHYNIGGLAKKIGIEEDDLSAGEFKKPISFFRKLEEKEKEYLKKQILTPTYDNFISSVAKNRDINITTLLPFTEGKIFIANDKSIRGVLVDEILVLHKVKNRIKKHYSQKVHFVDVLPKTPVGLFGSKVELNLNLDTNLNNTELK